MFFAHWWVLTVFVLDSIDFNLMALEQTFQLEFATSSFTPVGGVFLLKPDIRYIYIYPMIRDLRVSLWFCGRSASYRRSILNTVRFSSTKAVNTTWTQKRRDRWDEYVCRADLALDAFWTFDLCSLSHVISDVLCDLFFFQVREIFLDMIGRYILSNSICRLIESEVKYQASRNSLLHSVMARSRMWTLKKSYCRKIASQDRTEVSQRTQTKNILESIREFLSP